MTTDSRAGQPKPQISFALEGTPLILLGIWLATSQCQAERSEGLNKYENIVQVTSKPEPKASFLETERAAATGITITTITPMTEGISEKKNWGVVHIKKICSC